jgi:FkbM family methyltransferase
MAGRLDRLVLSMQNLMGQEITSLIKTILGNQGTRFLYDLIGRTARHHIELNCQKEMIGPEEEAWVICPVYLNPNGVVYSLGVGQQIQFDLELIERFKVDVFAFDPTPQSVDWIKKQNLPSQFHFIEYGIVDYDGLASFQHLKGIQFGIGGSAAQNDEKVELQVYRLKTIMKKFNHTKIDLLKINIEGGEYALIADLAASNLDVKQIVVEFHHRFPGYSLKQTKQAVKTLGKQGFKIFHIADNGKEYSFIKPRGNT